MKKLKLRNMYGMTLLIVCIISACSGRSNPPANCSADGPNCKQFNPNPSPKAAPRNCAADGPGCKQFNPNKPSN